MRLIESRDDPDIASIIRRVMPEFGAVGSGFAINDPEVDWMSRAYTAPRCAYFVVEQRDAVLGGGGIAPLAGSKDTSICELRKMYFLPQLRGLGAGHALIMRCLHSARTFGFQRCYVETLHGMTAAKKLYERSGFRRIDAPMGQTGHHGCNTFYLLDL